MIKLREYQEQIVRDVRNQLKMGNKSICVVLGCGGGKSIIQGMIAKTSTDRGFRVLFIVHRKELCEQIYETFDNCGVNWNLCKVGMVQTITNKINEEEKPDIIITDENHHCLATSYINIYNAFPEAIKLGFTATPIRMNDGGLGKIYGSMVTGVSVEWLIENKYLANYKLYSVRLIDATQCKTVQGDYRKADINELSEKKVIYGSTIKNYLAIAKNKKTIVYCSSVTASQSTAEEFIKNGISAAHLDAKNTKQERSDIIKKFRSGEILVLCNVDLFGEGFDVPDCECVILLRPTKSLALYIQQSMRSMRYKENKEAIIIDHVGNVFLHGFPDDLREWTLETKKKKQKNETTVKQCPMCFMCLASTERVCPCGYEFFTQAEQKKQAEVIEMQLQEIERIRTLPDQDHNYYKSLKTFEELKEFQKAKKYKFGWVVRKCRELDIEIPTKYKYYQFYNKR